ncbi:DedA family protein [Georgenia sp. TF02-10]|uniref:DedA family protein n=1 Tax=Georgenia sp. TF02-10 TaxID=2917725 RepID=UPI001FA7FF9B|nr:DedA family protein [Georgenia sp. TF02-10]UNX54326.1 DedA family protein [Georgenia sp. TF02-10]
MVEAMTAVEDFVLGLGASPWALLAVVVLATIDGFFPPVPSESIVISVAVLTVSGEEGPRLWLLLAAAAVGAFCGDVIAYAIGTRLPLDRIPLFRSPRGRRTLAWARRILAQRGTVFILSARFVPIGRVAVNMTAGAVGFPRRRFVVIAGFAAVVWGGYSVLLGMGAGVFLHEHPLIAVAVGVVGGVLIGLVVDRVLSFAHERWFPAAPTPAEVLLTPEEEADRAAGTDRPTAARGTTAGATTAASGTAAGAASETGAGTDPPGDGEPG